MKTILSVQNVNFSYEKKVVLKNINFTLSKNSWNTLIGPSGAGKTTLLHILLGLLKSDGKIVLDKVDLKEKQEEYLKKIGVVFENPELSFVTQTVKDDLAFTLENLQYQPADIKKRMKEVVELLDIKPFLNKNPHILSGGEKQMVALAIAIIHKPQLLILDEAFTMIDTIERQKILDKVKMLQKKENLTILHVTHDMEECYYSDTILLLQEGKIIQKASKEEIFKEEKKLTKLGLELPFLVSLCKKLQYYDLIQKDYYEKEQLVDAIWK